MAAMIREPGSKKTPYEKLIRMTSSKTMSVQKV